MAIDDLHLTILTLTNKNAALDRTTTELKNFLNGDFNHDAPIQAELASIHEEQISIASRLAAISSGQPFTPPQDSDVNALGVAITTLDQDIKANAALDSILTDATHIMQQYGAGSSGKPPSPEGG
jgi:hypothetical protein